MKKTNKTIALLLVMLMVVALSVSAYAADATTGQTVNAVNITKTLTMPDGTTTPESEFVFTVEKDASNGDSGAPAISNLKVDFEEGAEQTGNAVSGTVSLSTAIAAAMTNTPNGQYAYIVRESNTASSQAGEGETYSYDDTVYRVRVYKSSEGIKYTVTVVSNYGKQNESEAKSTFEPDTQGGDTYTADMPFANTYVKTNVVNPNGGKEPEDGNDAGGLYVQKTVANDDGKLYADKEFTFTLSVTPDTINSLSETKEGYSYKVYKVATDDTAASEVTNKAGTVKPNEDKTINLKTGERIVFIDLDVGAKVTVKEADYSEDFTQAATLNSEAVDNIVTGKEVTITETGNKLKVTNTYSNGKTTPEGILINNLPYIILAVLAIGGLTAYVMIRRKENEA